MAPLRRVHAAAGLVLTITLGIVSRAVRLGVYVWDKSLGDALYAVMIYLLLGLALPAQPPRQRGAVTFVLCFAIELFQLTGMPRTLPRPLRIVLGTDFAWHDVACYAVGAFVCVWAERALRDRA
jgi:hypothetical protein